MTHTSFRQTHNERQAAERLPEDVQGFTAFVLPHVLEKSGLVLDLGGAVAVGLAAGYDLKMNKKA